MFTHSQEGLLSRPPRVRLLLALAAALASFSAPAAVAQDIFGGGFQFPDPAGADSFALGDEELVTLSARYAPAPADAGFPAMVEVTATIANSYYIYSATQPAGGPQPTKLRLDPVSGATVAGPWVATTAPKTEIDQVTWIGLPIEKHFKTVTWRAPITFDPSVDPATATVSGTVDVQACDPGSCVPLDGLAFAAERVEPGAIPAVSLGSSADAADADVLPNEAEAPVIDAVSFVGLVPIVGAAILGGLILNLMPCVLPVIGL